MAVEPILASSPPFSQLYSLTAEGIFYLLAKLLVISRELARRRFLPLEIHYRSRKKGKGHRSRLITRGGIGPEYHVIVRHRHTGQINISGHTWLQSLLRCTGNYVP